MKIVVADRNLWPHQQAFEDNLPAGSQVTRLDAVDAPGADSVLAEAEVVVTSRFPAASLRRARALRLVHAAGAGLDSIAGDALPEGVRVANTFHHEDSIAEYVLASLILLRRRFVPQDRALRMGEWSSPVYDSALAQPRTLSGSVVTLLGFGHIGKAAWRLLHHLGAEGIAITGSGRVGAGEHGLRWAGTADRLEMALEQSDVVVVSIPLNPATRGLLGDRALQALGEQGLVVNVARGPVVDQQALFTALQSGRIAGAALDVWYRYPGADGQAEPADEPFHTLENVLMTPHSSGITTDTFHRRVLEIADNITRLAEGRDLKNTVTFDA